MFVKLFQDFLDNVDEFQKTLVMWCVERYIEHGLYCEIEPIKKEINDESINKLRRMLNELDGTLLVDLIVRFVHEHNIILK